VMLAPNLPKEQKVGSNITEGAQGLAKTIDKGIQYLSK
jgi:hypothetical protein